MSIVNKRNAVIGWLTIKAGKQIVKKKASDSTPSTRSTGAAAGTLAVLGSAVLIWRRARRGDEE